MTCHTGPVSSIAAYYSDVHPDLYRDWRHRCLKPTFVDLAPSFPHEPCLFASVQVLNPDLDLILFAYFTFPLLYLACMCQHVEPQVLSRPRHVSFS